MRLSILTSVLVLAVPGVALAQTDALARAHEQYNRQQYDAAIQSATDARRAPAAATAAAIVLSRAHLERYRQTNEAGDLEAARGALTGIERAALSPRERLDWTIGMGELLYFDRRFSTAAEFFEIGLAHLEMLEPGARDRLLEWWAEALDQQAQLGPNAERGSIYRRVLERAEEELRLDDRSVVAGYWLAAAAAGMDDFDRAWAAAEAGWLRASPTAPEGIKLRADLDRLIATVVIPQRARLLSPGDPFSAMRRLEEQWEELKARYARSH